MEDNSEQKSELACLKCDGWTLSLSKEGDGEYRVSTRRDRSGEVYTIARCSDLDEAVMIFKLRIKQALDRVEEKEVG